jgi:enamine deaminase RidA (YjgF/YER057c/UK114 family)
MSGRTRISSGSPWESSIGYSRAVKVGDHVWVSGTTGTHTDGTVPEGAIAQTRVALGAIQRALSDAGAAMVDVVAVRAYLVDITEWEAVGSCLGEKFGEVRPALVMVQVAALISPEHRVEIEVEAVIGSA